ncbi:MAG: SpoIID/LytB domain-containing protein [Clostridia bacterium]|nr:SpoIID/LytB domain-containing protein [Clostridia bacterium]
MSNLNPEQNSPRKRTREERKKLVVRIFALLMAILMVAGSAYYAIYLMTLSARAADVVAETEIVNTSSLKDGGDVPVRVGLMTGDGVTVGFEVTVTDGFVVGLTETTGNCSFMPIWELDNTRLSATVDGNLSKRNMTYSIAYDASSATVGGFHVQMDCDKYSRNEYTILLQRAEEGLAGYGFDVIPAYVYTGYTIRAGEFTTRAEAEKWVSVLQDIFPGETVYVTGASATSVSLIDPETDRILFEFDCGTESALGLQAKADRNGNTYLKTPAANVYDGTFVFSRYSSGTVSGVQLVNILPLEAYIAGVLPYEISNEWPLESLKAFALTVRSFTLTHMNRHGTYDMCNNAHCQVYKGAGRVNRNVMDAVKGTAGQVMTYNGEIVGAYYSSSMGGTTVSAKDAWGGDIPYLQAKATPWEDYMHHENAFWIVEMTPAELGERLRQAGHNIRGEVTDIRILQLAENSTYIKVLQVTDSSGNVVKITGTDAVRTSLTPNIKSANFVVGRGSVEYTEHVVDTSGLPEKPTEPEPPKKTTAVDSYDKDYGYINLYGYHVLTAAKEHVSDIDFSVTLMTGDGEQVYERQDIFVLSSESAGAFTGEDSVIREEEAEPEDTHVTETLDKSTEAVLYKVAYAANPNNFIFVGKGWGHGVGISQYGAYDLAGRGYSFRQILEAYFDGIAIVQYRDTENYR